MFLEIGKTEYDGLSYIVDGERITSKNGWKEPNYELLQCKVYVSFKSVERFKKYLEEANEIDNGHNKFYTDEEYNVYKQEMIEKKKREERRQMEQLCSVLIEKYGIVHVDSVEFFNKVHELAEDDELEVEHRLEGMREDGLCIGMGVSIEEWCDHRDAIKAGGDERRSQWWKLFKYLNQEFPIVAAKHRQQQMVGV